MCSSLSFAATWLDTTGWATTSSRTIAADWDDECRFRLNRTRPNRTISAIFCSRWTYQTREKPSCRFKFKKDGMPVLVTNTSCSYTLSIPFEKQNHMRFTCDIWKDFSALDKFCSCPVFLPCYTVKLCNNSIKNVLLHLKSLLNLQRLVVKGILSY